MTILVIFMYWRTGRVGSSLSVLLLVEEPSLIIIMEC